MPSFTDHANVLAMLAESQDADKDNRQYAREAHIFIDKRDGQWEQKWWDRNADNPRYTFDMTGPIVDTISGEMEKADFNITVSPASGEASKDDAKLYDGIIRNIENISGATDIFNLAGRNMITCGLDGWMVKQELVDDDSFDQDLVIKRIANFIDSVWFGPFKEPDASDTKWCVVLEAMNKRAYEEKYPEGSGMSVSDGRQNESYYHKDDQVIIANIYYIEEKERELLLMTSGRVLEADQAKDVLDELSEAGDTVKARRMRKKNIVKSRLFDGGVWLNEEQETVFNQIPVIPTIGNFKIFENKLIYRGVVDKIMDPQRVLNYSKSREIGEGSLAPRSKYWMTRVQSAGEEDTLRTLNTNADPVQFYNNDAEVPGPPQQQGGAAINPGLAIISSDMNNIIQQVSSLYDPNLGVDSGAHSGVAIKSLQNKGDTGNIKYFNAQERAICRTARILVDTIPVVKNTEQQQRILGEDGSSEIKTLNQPVFDQESGRMITVNDVSKGKYDVTCSAGKSFQSMQEETVAAMTEMTAVDPSVMQLGGDILYNNLKSPGMDLLAQRKRQQLFQAGVIPIDQMTDEEKQQVQAAQQQPQQPDPATLLAQAEIGKAQAQTNKVQVEAQVAQRRENREDAKAQSQIQNTDFNQILAMKKQQEELRDAVIDNQKTMAETMKLIREAMGVDSIVGPHAQAAFINSAIQTNDSLK